MRIRAWVMWGVVWMGVGPRARAAVDPDWTTPIAPFRIAGNLYYVGSRDLAAYLVVTPAGDVLINSNLASSAVQIEHSVEQLGFRVRDIKVLLISHAHTDHAAGSAAILRATGARYEVMDGDVDLVESGGRTDFAFGHGTMLFPRAKVDRVLHDGDVVRLGGTELVAHRTAGHTRGCTTWTMKVEEGGRREDVVIVGSWSVLSEYRLVATRAGRPASYPQIAADYEHSFAVWMGLPCDIFLGAHGSYFDMLGKLSRMPKEGASVWVDPAGYHSAVLERRAAFERELRRQEQAAATPRGPAGATWRGGEPSAHGLRVVAGHGGVVPLDGGERHAVGVAQDGREGLR